MVRIFRCNGTFFQGNTEEGIAQGFGLLQYTGSGTHYMGNFKDDMPNGEGLLYTNGAILQGDFVDF